MNSSTFQSDEKTTFFSELNKFANVIEFKFTYTEEIKEIKEVKEIMTNLISFLVKNYSACKCNFFGITIFEQEFTKIVFVENILKLKNLTIGMFIIRNFIENEELHKDKILILSSFLFTIEDENLYISIKNINSSKKYNIEIEMSKYYLENDKIIIDSKRLIIINKSNNDESLEKYNNSYKKELNVNKINKKSLLKEETTSDTKVSENDAMMKMMMKMEELETNMKNSKIENQREMEKLGKKIENELGEKMEKELETKLQESKKVFELIIGNLETEISQIKVEVKRLKRINYSVWIREIIERVYNLIKIVNNIPIKVDEYKQKEIEKIKNNLIFKFFTFSKDFPFSETIIKLLKLKTSCNYLLHLQYPYHFNKLEDLNSTEKVIDSIKEFNPKIFNIEELMNFANFLNYTNFNKLEVISLDKDANIDTVRSKLIKDLKNI